MNTRYWGFCDTSIQNLYLRTLVPPLKVGLIGIPEPVRAGDGPLIIPLWPFPARIVCIAVEWVVRRQDRREKSLCKSIYWR